MEIITNYNNKKEWDQFVVDNTSPASFLQSFDWGEFNKEMLGYKIERTAFLDDGEMRVAVQGIDRPLPLGQRYIYCPRGLVWDKEYSDKRAAAYGKILEKGRSDLKDRVFLRVNPPYEYKDYVVGFLGRVGFQKPKILTHSQEPGSTILIDLTKSEEELLEAMHPKTRYNIRLAEKKGVKIKFPISPGLDKRSGAGNFQFPINTFYKLSEETAGRNKIKIYEKEYYEKLIGFFGDNSKDMKLKLYFAEYEGKALGTIMAVYFGDTATYLHGASSNDSRDLMPNYLLQWTAMKEAKQAGYKIYDLWGASEENEAWAGITRFKKGFGGTEYRFLGTWDYVLRPGWYNMMRGMRLIRKMIP
ncbi:MAG TPA: peptidoglycan bridge formation glycyltransferase FemA/FemB family protein [Patescibacteria group bacterium]|nr:peptidoglycan bridge formation glycyltransferase FemA/FemB family protein [Patescibacteria group bacterium]